MVESAAITTGDGCVGGWHLCHLDALGGDRLVDLGSVVLEQACELTLAVGQHDLVALGHQEELDEEGCVEPDEDKPRGYRSPELVVHLPRQAGSMSRTSISGA